MARCKGCVPAAVADPDRLARLKALQHRAQLKISVHLAIHHLRDDIAILQTGSGGAGVRLHSTDPDAGTTEFEIHQDPEEGAVRFAQAARKHTDDAHRRGLAIRPGECEKASDPQVILVTEDERLGLHALDLEHREISVAVDSHHFGWQPFPGPRAAGEAAHIAFHFAPLGEHLAGLDHRSKAHPLAPDANFHRAVGNLPDHRLERLEELPCLLDELGAILGGRIGELGRREGKRGEGNSENCL